ncbi:MAG: hypothetical protein SFV81_15795 [Pirellulaceae bacterium]|nr:hypothetical protein [Pirellulaceae bacterium]
MKLAHISTLAILSLTILSSSFQANSVFAQEKHEHAPGHDADAMKKAELKISGSLKSLSPEDQKLASAQRFCPMMAYSRLGAMGAPIKLTIAGKPVFVCCDSCREDAIKGGDATVKTTQKLIESTAVLAKLPMEERMAAEAQKYCAVANGSFLGSMGAPIKLTLDGKPVYLCCGGCTKKAQENPAATLTKVAELISAGKKDGHEHDHAEHKK